MKLKLKILVATLLVIAVTAAFWALIRDNTFDVLQPAGAIADEQKNLIIFASLLSLIVIIPVFAMTFWIVWKYRVGHTKPGTYAPGWHSSPIAETIWWGVPIILILILGVVIWKSSHQLDPYRSLDSPKQPLKVQVVALQWRWLFIYPEQKIATINFLQIPVDRPVDFELTSDAPMNSFWIPKLGGQVYAMSGMSTQLHLQAHTKGDYAGKTANISGEGYSGMVFTTRVTSQPEFDAWAKSLKNAPDLTKAGYDKLAKPSHNSDQVSFRLQAENLYDTVIMKYMMPGDDQASATEHHHE